MQNSDYAVIIGVGVGIVTLYLIGGLAAVLVGAALADLAIRAIRSRQPVSVDSDTSIRDESGK